MKFSAVAPIFPKKLSIYLSFLINRDYIIHFLHLIPYKIINYFDPKSRASNLSSHTPLIRIQNIRVIMRIWKINQKVNRISLKQ